MNRSGWIRLQAFLENCGHIVPAFSWSSLLGVIAEEPLVNYFAPKDFSHGYFLSFSSLSLFDKLLYMFSITLSYTSTPAKFLVHISHDCVKYIEAVFHHLNYHSLIAIHTSLQSQFLHCLFSFPVVFLLHPSKAEN